MSHPAGKGGRSYIFAVNFENMKMIRNIIFDLGGVLFDINYQNIIDAFRNLGISNFDALYTQLKQDHLFDQLETGSISADEFRNRIRAIAERNIEDIEIDKAWNAILIGFPQKNVDLLLHLKNHYRLFLLSNTNEIHEAAFRAMISKQYNRYIFDELFERVYLSHHIHMRKPDTEIFLKVVRENNLAPVQTLFIDDSPQHVEGAKTAGLQSIWLKNGEWVGDYFKGDSYI